MKMRPFQTCLATAVALLAVGAAAARDGVAELRLDATAVATILAAALPEPTRLDLPGIGSVTLIAGPVRAVAFRDGAVEATLALTIQETGWSSDLALRFLPDVERTTGTARLVVDRATLPGLPFDVDLAGWFRPATLPRSVRWALEMQDARPLPLTCYVQGITVEDERLRVDLGLVGG